MISGLRMIIRDKLIFTEEQGSIRQLGKPMDILRRLAEETKLLHIVDMNALNGNMTNFDVYDHMTYALNIEVECAPREEQVKKLIARGARAVFRLPCALDLSAFGKNRRLLVGKTNGTDTNDDVFDYYIESEDIKIVEKVCKLKRTIVYSKTLEEKAVEKAGAFALIRDFKG